MIGDILDGGATCSVHPVETLPHVETLDGTRWRSGSARQQSLDSLVNILANPSVGLILITKGDLFDQERKLADPASATLRVEIVSDKTRRDLRSQSSSATATGPSAP